jgi:hypothetical protein
MSSVKNKYFLNERQDDSTTVGVEQQRYSAFGERRSRSSPNLQDSDPPFLNRFNWSAEKFMPASRQPPARDQDDSTRKDRQTSYDGESNHEDRRLDFFNLFWVGLEVDHGSPHTLQFAKIIEANLIGIQGGKL